VRHKYRSNIPACRSREVCRNSGLGKTLKIFSNIISRFRIHDIQIPIHGGEMFAGYNKSMNFYKKNEIIKKFVTGEATGQQDACRKIDIRLKRSEPYRVDMVSSLPIHHATSTKLYYYIITFSTSISRLCRYSSTLKLSEL
jgi:hypothetical protein